MLQVTTVRAFSDNYLWLVHGLRDATRVAAVDPGDAAAIERALAAGALTLDVILVTHHHADHTGGVLELAQRHAVPVIGPTSEEIPGRTRGVRQGDQVVLERLGLEFGVLDVPGHTAGHVAYAGHGAVFCGDTLFSGGCGRLFEGTAAQMQTSLDRLAALPDETLVYCAHEYTASNLRFARHLEPDNGELEASAQEVATLRAAGRPTLPTPLDRERRLNPFLRCDEQAFVEKLDLLDRTAAEVFGVIRARKDAF